MLRLRMYASLMQNCFATWGRIDVVGFRGCGMGF